MSRHGPQRMKVVSSSRWLSISVSILVVLICFAPTRVIGFIPAQPVNDTSSFNISQDLITVAFYNGVYQAPISRQLTADAIDDEGNYTSLPSIVSWTRYSKGVLVHFDEADRNQGPSDVPWIAMINCDTNGTDYSQDDDIFTLTRDQGAQAALLYSVYSAGCLMNPEYLSPEFQKVLDVYATTSLPASRIIENQFSNPGISPSAYNFNASLLNASTTTIDALLNSPFLDVTGNVPINYTTAEIDSIMASPTASPTVANQRRQLQSSTTTMTITRTTSTRSATPTASSPPNYLAAVMAASNNTVGATTTTPSASATPASTGGGNSSTSLAMIILYAITGVVTSMFLVVILSGAIRAVRHPERYGPRATMFDDDEEGGHGNGQTRTQGLTRAILDTFPVVKFGRGGQDSSTNELRNNETARTPVGTSPPQKDFEMEERPSFGSVPEGPLASARQSTSTETQEVLEPAPGLAVVRDRTLSQQPSMGSMSFVSAVSSPDAIASSTVRSPVSPILPMSAAPNEGDTEIIAEVPRALPLTTNPVDVNDGTTCPVCLCDFDDGDDVRILPCDGRHRFHCECIDPWLLQVSSLCPLCRLDLNGAIKAKNQAVSGSRNANANEASRSSEEGEDDERSEMMIRAHLRSMLPGRNRSESTSNSASGSGSGGDRGSIPASGAANKFFRYVARRRQHGGNDAGRLNGGHDEPSTNATS